MCQRFCRATIMAAVMGAMLLVSGCAVIKLDRQMGRITPEKQHNQIASNAKKEEIIPVAHLSFASATLSLDDLLNIAAQQNPIMAGARAKTVAAHGAMIQAGLYPNPVIAPEIDNVGAKRDAVGEPGVNFFQQIVTAGKLRLDQSAAAHGVTAADWQATTRWFEVVTNVRKAYFQLLAAEKEVKATTDIVQVAENSLSAANKLLKAGVGNRPDVLRAEVELDQARMNLETAKRRVSAGRRLLAAAAGIPQLPNADVQGNLGEAVPVFEWDVLHRHVLASSSEIREAEAVALQAEELLLRAQVQTVPDIQLHLRPSYFLPENSTLFFVRAGVAVPVFNRNQGNILAAEANLAQARAGIGKVQLLLTERLTNAFQKYQIALQQSNFYRERILTNARKSVQLVQFGYEKGDPKYDYTALLQAQQVLFQAELAYVRSLGELWQAVAEIDGLIQRPA